MFFFFFHCKIKKQLSGFNTSVFTCDNKNNFVFRLDELQMELDWKSQKLQEQVQINQILLVNLYCYFLLNFFAIYYEIFLRRPKNNETFDAKK